MDTSTLHLPLRSLASVSNAEHASVRDAHGQVLFAAPRPIAALIVAAVNANQKMVDALRLIRNQSIGSDWTPEQAMDFCKQHAGETIKAVDGARSAAICDIEPTRKEA